MKVKSYALKPWWPRRRRKTTTAATSAPPDRLAFFCHQIVLTARWAGLSRQVQEHAIAALAHCPAIPVRPDIGRQAAEWLAEHQPPPPTKRGRRSRPASFGERTAERCCSRIGGARVPASRISLSASSGERAGERCRSHVTAAAVPASPRPNPATLAREALVVHLREQDGQRFKQIGGRLGITREKTRQIYARALRRRSRVRESAAIFPV